MPCTTIWFGSTPAMSAVASSPREHTPSTCSLLRDPPCDCGGQERLSRINQASLRERRAVAPNPMTKVGLIDDVGRGAEFIGDLGQRHLTDTEPTQLIDVSGQWPYRPVYSGCGGVPQRRQDLKESHRNWLPLPQLIAQQLLFNR